MGLQITGRLHAKFPTQQIKENFSKREFVLELTEESPTGMVFTNYASFQLMNNTCSVVDQFQEGQTLTVDFNIRGNRWEKDGHVKYITNLNAWRVMAAAGATQQAPQQQQQPAPDYFPQQPPNTTAGSANPNYGPDDLPF